MSSRRTILQRTAKTNSTHAGLWLDKYLYERPETWTTPRNDSNARSPDTLLVAQCSAIPEPVDYLRQFERWLETLYAMGIKPRLATVTGRLAIGLGNETVIETGATFHQTYGVPIIRGSALKGLASSYAHQQLQKTVWAKGTDAHNTLFGTTSSAGFVTFFDALPQPDTWKLRPDVITVHHPDYYRGNGSPPADWDNPTPISFLTVTGNFLIALHASDAPAWAEVGYGILGKALQEMGIGAKTSSGYGRMNLRANPMKRPFKLKKGAFIRAIVTKIVGGDVELQLRDKFAKYLPKDKEIYIYMPHNQVGNRTYQVDSAAACIIEEVDDEYEYVLTCRPATKEEKQQNA
ncbi:CRISPR-associated RAMP Cmr6 [hydrothermal vent metagenome]|uniref:CRISPR-associated RAMP Cmr6 n=1 Tax=hydrothermal vent metagenome TaxID=652676 RepID=A0A3B0UVS3_9ZZZZ